MLIRNRRNLLLAMCLSLTGASYAHAEITAESQKPVKLAQLNLPEADFITFTFGAALKKAGYQVEYVQADYAAHFTALELGDIDISTTAYSSTPDLIKAAVDSGKVLDLGSTGVAVEESWWFPNYVAEACPGLPDWKALTQQACIDALSNPEAPGKIHYIGTPADWAPHDEERIASLGLNVDVVLPGSKAAMVAAMDGAIKRKENIIGFATAPHWLYGNPKIGQFIKFPVYAPECMSDPSWGVNPNEIGDCALPTGTVEKLANKETKDTAAGAIKILERFQLDAAAVSKASGQIEVENMTTQQAAEKWIAENNSIVESWLK